MSANLRQLTSHFASKDKEYAWHGQKTVIIFGTKMGQKIQTKKVCSIEITKVKIFPNCKKSFDFSIIIFNDNDNNIKKPLE